MLTEEALQRLADVLSKGEINKGKVGISVVTGSIAAFLTYILALMHTFKMEEGKTKIS